MEIRSVENTFTAAPLSLHLFLQPYYQKLRVFFTEAFCTFTAVLPSAIKWTFCVKLKRNFTTYQLNVTSEKVTKVAYLYFHDTKHKTLYGLTNAALLLHGDMSFPATMLPLADRIKQKGVAVFSLHMPFDATHTTSSQKLLQQAINKVNSVIKERGGSLSKLVAVGHSKGAIQSAHEAFVNQNPHLSAVIAIAGRLKVVESKEKPCHSELQPLVNEIYAAIQANPNFPLYQIVPEDDWNAPVEAMAIRPQYNNCRIIPGAMHLNVLYQDATYVALHDFIDNSLQH